MKLAILAPAALALTLSALTLGACSSDGPVEPPPPASVNSFVEGKVTVHKVKVSGLDNKSGWNTQSTDVLTWCEGTTLYATTPVYVIERGAAGGGIALLADGCKDGVPK